MRNKTAVSKIFTFHPYLDDQFYLGRQLEGPRRRNETVREWVNHGTHLFKLRPKRHRTIRRDKRPLGDPISVTLFEADAQFLTSLVNPETTVADILREMLSISIGSRKFQAAKVSDDINQRLTSLEDALKTMSEMLLILTSRVIYGLETSNNILGQLITDPAQIKSIHTKIQKQGTVNLGDILTKITQEEEIPEWLLVKLNDKIQKTKEKRG